MNFTEKIAEGVKAAVAKLYDHPVDLESIMITNTRKEFTGDYTVVVFPFTKPAKKKPAEIGQELGEVLKADLDIVAEFNVVKGFLNLSIDNKYWLEFSRKLFKTEQLGQAPANGKKVMVEFSSPNTNKPLHLGHIRNILLGWSCSQILDRAGYEVIKTQIVNDRGIAICKSMLAWEKFGAGETPDSSGIKGDFLAGKYYVLFEQKFKAEYQAWQQTDAAKAVFAARKKSEQSEPEFWKDYKNTYFNDYSELGKEAKAMLLKWEDNDPAVRQLWSTMNGWVYDGFAATYKALGVDFDKLYYESDTYLEGKRIIADGLAKEVFYKKEDGSVWIDLESAKMDHKLVLRSDGTSVYMTQDIGTAQLRSDDFGMDKMVYVVGDEQDYHFKVLFETMKRLGAPYAKGLHHLSYGMVDLPTGKMKSREGTVVDADELIRDVVEVARVNMVERNEVTGKADEDMEEIIRRIGMAALKYFIIKVNPKKRMVFNPNEAVDIQGQTGPYIQYAFVRAKGVYEKAVQDQINLSLADNYSTLKPVEKELIFQISQYPGLVLQAAETYDPSLIANYCYNLARSFNKLWHEVSILNAEQPETIAYRVKLSKLMSETLKDGMQLLGIEMPERM